LLPVVAAATRHTAATDQVKSLDAIKKKFKNKNFSKALPLLLATPARSLSPLFGKSNAEKLPMTTKPLQPLAQWSA